MALKTILLTQKEIKKLLPIQKTLSIVEASFRAHGLGKVLLPPKLYLTLPKTGDFRAMPAYLSSPECCGIKWVNVHPQNRLRHLPTVMALIILNDPATGFPLAVLDGTYITQMRTGAGGGVAARYMARRDSAVLGLVGCGAQAETQLLFISKLFRLKKVKFWGLTEADRIKFYGKMKKSGLPLQPTDTARETVIDSDIVVTTTPSTRPIVHRDWVKPGTHINAIGADAKGKEELEVSLLKVSRIVIDDWHQASESGEINVPFAKGMISKKNIYGSLGEIVCGKKKGRMNRSEITVFDATGLAIQDVSVAWVVYHEAKRRGIGKEIAFF